MPTDFNDPISSFLADKSMSVPLGQVLLFAFMLTLCLLFGRHKLGLMVYPTHLCFTGDLFLTGAILLICWVTQVAVSIPMGYSDF